MEKIKLGDLCNPNHGQISTKSDTIIDYIDISSVDNESKTVTGYQTMVFGEAPSRARKMVKRGNILVSTVRPNLNAVAMITDDTPNLTVASTGFCVLDCKKNVDKRFVFNFCKSKAFVDEMISQATGASYPAVSDKIVRSALVPVYSFDEQKRIGELLDKIALIVDLRKRELANLDELVKAQFVELFGTVDNNVFNYPIVRLGDYAKLQGGYAFKSNDFVDEGIPLVQIGNVNKDYLDWDVINAVPDEYLGRYSEFSLCNGDLVMAMTRPIIKSLNSVKIAKVSKNDVPCLLNQRVGRFILSDSLNSLFLETLCKSDDFKDYVERMSGNSLQPNISSKQVEDYLIILPPKDLQEQFSVFVKQVDKLKSEVQRALDETQLLFNSLMQEYFG